LSQALTTLKRSRQERPGLQREAVRPIV
jgi:hypothetical protein